MRMRLTIELDTEFYNIEDWRKVKEKATSTGAEVFSWKTTGRNNWLERGFSKVDCLGLVVLPAGLQEVIPMPDDPCD